MTMLGKLRRSWHEWERRMRVQARVRGEFKEIKDDWRRKMIESFPLSPDQERAIDDYFMQNVGIKIPYDWHREYSSLTGKFHKEYVPEFFYTAMLQFGLCDLDYARVIDDKNFSSLLSCTGVRTPRTIVRCSNGCITDPFSAGMTVEEAIDTLFLEDSFILKKTSETTWGKDVFLVERKEIERGDLKRLLLSLGRNWRAEQRIVACKEITALHPASLNTFRVASYVLDGKAYADHAVLRIGVGDSHLDNSHSGGIFIGIDQEGRLREEAFTEKGVRWEGHPNSGLVFNGYLLPLFSRVLVAACNIQSFLAKCPFLDLDITLDENYIPVLTEINPLDGSAAWMLQMGNGEPMFNKERIPSILNLCRRFL